jgi:HlyD family secretion protein
MKRAIIVIIVLALLGGGFFLTKKLQAASPEEKTQYKIAKAETGMVKKTVSATGTLQPWRVVDIKSKAGGRVDVMAVDVGAVVKPGQVICKIDPSDTQLNVAQAQADIDSAAARIQSSQMTYELQKEQSRLAVATARAALDSAKASLSAAKARRNTSLEQKTAQPKLTTASIASAQANYENAKEQLDEMVEATLPGERANAQAAVDQAKANLTNADNNLRRQQTLMDKGFVSVQVVDSAQANRDVAQAQLNTAKQKLSTIEREQSAARAAMEARVAQAKAQLENAQAAGVDVRIRNSSYEEAQAAVKQAEHQVTNAEKNLLLAEANMRNIDIRKTDILTANATRKRAMAAYINADKTFQQTTVTAPSAGVILKKYVEQGTIISSALSFAATGNNIVQLGDTTRMYVDVTVDETDIANVEDGQMVDITVEAYPSTPLEGKVIRIDPQTEVIQNVNMIHVRVEIDNSSQIYQLMKPGMNATCEFVISKKDDVVNVPTEAVRQADEGRYVEIAKGGVQAPPDAKTGTPAEPDTKVDVVVERRPVEAGLEGNDTTEIISGLKEGEVIITQKIEPAPKTAGSPFGGQRMGGFGGGGGRR